ncbi:MAG: bifunctional phosphopantothenoylcysteine decarboxylase/phosphopantothenate--cysteine ligase CoaBC [Candidatus Nanopelagicales bacterium]|nr:bifunctional phosphopantothenoylcysteine decarboxylase/phosphopantothenate--cysteine ligase CoaBC [Candidatus Nanopelagicales bacterium]
MSPQLGAKAGSPQVGDRPRVVLGVAGGIAAYKGVEVLRGLTESGHSVTVVPTAAALKFVGEPTWAALSAHPIATSVWANAHEVSHVKLGQQADCVVVAPATADLIARATHGIANDLLTNVLLTARCPIVLAPAMHTEMWQHPATQCNVAALRARGVIVLEPAAGRLTGADFGPGRLPDPAAIVAAVQDVLRRPPTGDLAGRRVVVSAGGTRESWDPVRFIGNISSGRQGVELARTAVSRGALVTLVAAHLDVPIPAGVTVVPVSSAEDLLQAMAAAARDADAVVMAAAVADFRPEAVASGKIKKPDEPVNVSLKLSQTVDVLAELVRRREGELPVIVGFAAETAADATELAELGRRKLARKGCELLVVNEVGRQVVFGAEENEVTILGHEGTQVHVARSSKAAISDAVWDAVVHEWKRA